MKKILLLLIIAGLGVGGWFYFRSGNDDAPEYQTAAVVRGNVTQAVTATGTLNPVVKVQVGSQISGNIQKLFADFNTEVKAGQVVAQLDPATYQAVVHQIEAELLSAEAALRLAEFTAKRQRDLTAQKIGTAAALDDAEAGLSQAQATVAIRKAQLSKAKVDLGRCTIYAPIDGVVISRDVDVGQTVAASLSAPIIFVIANDLRKMQINTSVAEADVGNIEMGQNVEFTVDAYQYRKFRGKVVQVRNMPITVQNVVTYDTIIEVSNDDLKLKPGMTANVSIIINEREDVVKVPNAALRFRPPQDPQKPTPAPGGPTPGGPTPAGPPDRRVASATPGQPTPNGEPTAAGGNAARGERGERRGRGGPGGGSGGRRREGGGAPGGPMERTVYLFVAGQPQPTKVKLGISDGIHTEVIEGLKEGDVMVTGVTTPQGAETSQRPGSSPFGGGGMRRF
jgi:HlyD family secretion protein